MEHPDITKANNTGYPHGEPDRYHCPICGDALNYDEKIYTLAGKVVACEHCVDCVFGAMTVDTYLN